jgi:hypothetical protein
MPILDKVNLPYLDQFHRRQCLPPFPCPGNVQPAFLVVLLERIKVAVKISAAAFTAPNLADGHGAYPGVAVSVYGTGSVDLIQGQQVVRAPGQHRPEQIPLTPVAGASASVQYISRLIEHRVIPFRSMSVNLPIQRSTFDLCKKTVAWLQATV